MSFWTAHEGEVIRNPVSNLLDRKYPPAEVKTV
jgi:hypothetical protein